MKAKTCKDNDGSAVCDLMLSIVNCCFKSDHYHCAVFVCAKDDTLVVHDCFVLNSTRYTIQIVVKEQRAAPTLQQHYCATVWRIRENQIKN